MTPRKKQKTARKRVETRLWHMCDKPPARLTFYPKKRGDYWRRVTLEMPLYEGLIQAIEEESEHSMFGGMAGEWLYFHILELVRREHGERTRVKKP